MFFHHWHEYGTLCTVRTSEQTNHILWLNDTGLYPFSYNRLTYNPFCDICGFVTVWIWEKTFTCESRLSHSAVLKYFSCRAELVSCQHATVLVRLRFSLNLEWQCEVFSLYRQKWCFVFGKTAVMINSKYRTQFNDGPAGICHVIFSILSPKKYLISSTNIQFCLIILWIKIYTSVNLYLISVFWTQHSLLIFFIAHL